MKKLLIIVVVIGVAGVAWQYRNSLIYRIESILPENSNAIQGSFVEDAGESIEVIAEDLDIPWEVAFLPGGDLLVTERPGTLKRIGENGKTYEIEGVRHAGEGGLLGMALHPDFEKNQWIYLYLTTQEGGETTNRVDRYKYDSDRLTNRTTIIQKIPGSRFHDGGRIEFGPDGKLYITTGDAGQPFLAQDRNSLAGKTLRLEDDGRVPRDNPFDSPVWSYGHRNSQGLAWDSQGRLWATEHGRSGLRSGFDEINLIEKGKNYGWPVVQGDEDEDGLESPVLHSGSDTWAPAGAVFWKKSILFGGLRGEALYQFFFDESGDTELVAHFQNQFGRIRAVALGPDGQLYITTSNTDGRGRNKEGDDKIIKLNPKSLIVPNEVKKRFK